MAETGTPTEDTTKVVTMDVEASRDRTATSITTAVQTLNSTTQITLTTITTTAEDSSDSDRIMSRTTGTATGTTGRTSIHSRAIRSRTTMSPQVRVPAATPTSGAIPPIRAQ